MSLAVVGTDTGVGKTVVSALLLERYGRALPLAYWKPVASGARDERDSATVASLVGAPFRTLAEEYLLPEPLSPHLAARRAGVTIEPARLIDAWALHRRLPLGVVVEGAGGLLVPLTDRGSRLVDVLAAFALPFVLAARSSLGTINHTLLTLEALRTRRAVVAGVVMVGAPDPDNREAIERFGAVEVLAEVPWLTPLDAAALAAAAPRFDPAGRLAPLLTAPPDEPDATSQATRPAA